MMKKPLISVVVNTHKRLKNLKILLAALRYQSYDHFEVIVVNKPSMDGTEEYVKQFKDIKYADCLELNLSKSRNIGIAMASGEYIAFIDDDAIPEPQWLTSLYEKFQTSAEIAAVGGYVKDYTGVTFQAKKLAINRCCFYQQNDDFAMYPHCFVFYYPMGCNCMFDRKKLLQVGGFDEQYDYYADETDLCARLIDYGYTVAYAPQAFVIHKFASSPLRDQRKVVLDWTKIIKNTVYFILSYADIAGKEICDNAIKQHLTMRKDEMLFHFKSGNINQAEYKKAIESIDNGWQQGLRDASRGSKLTITPETLAKYSCPPVLFDVISHSEKSLNIVFFVDLYPPKILGGIGRFVHQKAIGMARSGHQVHVITPTDLDHDTVDFEDNVWVHRITFKQYPDHLLQRDTCCCDFFMPRMNQLYSYYEELLKIEERTHVDIVETPIWDCLGFYAMMDSRFKTIVSLQSCMKSVFTDPATMPKGVKNYIQLENELLHKNKYIMPISNAIQKQLEVYYDLDLSSKSDIVNLGLSDLAKDFVPEKRKDDKIEILFLGRLEQRKGVDVLLKTIPELVQKYPDLIFRFAGDNSILVPGKDLTFAEEFFAIPGNEKYRKNCVFEGIVSEERMRQLYAQCDIFVSPSRYESFGLIFLEAMMFSKPVVGCNIGGMPEVIGEHLKTGLLAEPEDVASLISCLDILISSPELREQIGKSGRERYEKHFTEKIMVENSLDYYYKILEKSL